MIAKAVNWVLQHQSPEGAFYETTWLPDRKYNSTLVWPGHDPVQHRNITLTAHVLIMLESVKDLTSKTIFFNVLCVRRYFTKKLLASMLLKQTYFRGV